MTNDLATVGAAFVAGFLSCRELDKYAVRFMAHQCCRALDGKTMERETLLYRLWRFVFDESEFSEE